MKHPAYKIKPVAARLLCVTLLLASCVKDPLCDPAGSGGDDAASSVATLRLLLTLPDSVLPDYAATKATGATPALRLTVEAYRQGTQTRVLHEVMRCTEQADSTWQATLTLAAGSYDLRLWADWATDGTTGSPYYDTDDLAAVTVLTDNYVAGELTGAKDAAYATAAVTLAAGGTHDEAVTLVRPLARYRLVATDVADYLALAARDGDGLPPLSGLQVRVAYAGFFPTGFNVATGRPNDALTGIAYTTAVTEADGYDPADARQVGADFVLAGDDDSSVTVTVQLTDTATGETVSTLTGIRIPYRRGCLTTVAGSFLTAGRAGGGVQVDTGWSDQIVIPF